MLIAPLRNRTEDGFDYRILLLQRNKGSSTFNSAHVFPGKLFSPLASDHRLINPFGMMHDTGGNIDAGDRLAAWDEFYPTSQPLDEAGLRERAIKICALRETFEEAGVLLSECTSAVGGGQAKWDKITEIERRTWRDKVGSSNLSLSSL